MQDKYIIHTDNLSFSYDESDNRVDLKKIPALNSVCLSVERGEYIAILGHNGSGKSTLAKLLNLILVPTAGKIYVDGIDVSSPDLSDDEIFEVRKKIGMVFQNPDNQIVSTIVEEDVAFGVENLGLPREEIRRRITSALNVVGMQDYAHHAPHKLSGGQRQRVAIAGVIAMKPQVIILDEATAMLDPLGRKEVINIIEKLNKEDGVTILNITHHMDEASRADRVIVMSDGCVCADGTPQSIFSRPDFLHSIGLESPQGIELLSLLRESGMDTDIKLSDIDGYVDSIYCSIKCREKDNKNE